MNQHELQKRLIRYQGEIEQLGFWLSRAKQSLPEDFEGYRRSLQDASGLAERPRSEEHTSELQSH